VVEIESIKKNYEDILSQLSDPGVISDWEKFEELSKMKKELEKIIEKEKEIKEIKNQIEENKTILKTEEDKELVSLAETEIGQFQEKEKILEKELRRLLENDNFSSPRLKNPAFSGITTNTAVIIEIRAGTGGQEAALFAGNLFRMYSKYAIYKNWKEKILDSHPTGLGGFKEIIFELNTSSPKTVRQNRAIARQEEDKDIFSKMKYEAGVHRVQRIPETEKSGRIHTSTATVAVLLKPKATEVKIKPNEIKTDFYHSSGPGGQNVNKRMTAVRITHLPTGLIVASQNERNQLQNKENALSILAARILEKKETESQAKIGDKRKAQIGWAKRAEKIRTYNFPQNRVTDHRIKKSWHNIEEVMEGKLDKIIGDLQKNLK